MPEWEGNNIDVTVPFWIDNKRFHLAAFHLHACFSFTLCPKVNIHHFGLNMTSGLFFCLNRPETFPLWPACFVIACSQPLLYVHVVQRTFDLAQPFLCHMCIDFRRLGTLVAQ